MAKDHLQRGSNALATKAMVAGAALGAIARFFTAPLDTVKIRLQVLNTKVLVTQMVVLMVKNEGVKSFWKGNVPAEIMYVLYGATQFTTYQKLNQWLAQWEQRHPDMKMFGNPSFHALITGFGAGSFSTVVTYPFDLLRTRLAAAVGPLFLSMRLVLNHIQQVGRKSKLPVFGAVEGLFVGICPTMLAVALNTGVMFSTYAYARQMSNQYPEIPFIEGACGFVAGAVAKTVTFPLDTIRKRCQIGGSNENKIRATKVCRDLWQVQGVQGFYRGLSIAILKAAPTLALSMAVYEWCMLALDKIPSKDTLLNEL